MTTVRSPRQLALLFGGNLGAELLFATTFGICALAYGHHVPLVDLHARSIEYCEQIGPAATARLNPLKPDGTRDTTHLEGEGRVVFGLADVRAPILALVLVHVGNRLASGSILAAWRLCRNAIRDTTKGFLR